MTKYCKINSILFLSIVIFFNEETLKNVKNVLKSENRNFLKDDYLHRLLVVLKKQCKYFLEKI